MRLQARVNGMRGVFHFAQRALRNCMPPNSRVGLPAVRTLALCNGAAKAPIVPLDAAMLGALDVSGVRTYVISLGVDADEAQKLFVQKIDGAALLEMTVDEVRSYGVVGGVAHRIIRAVAAAANAVTLTVYPPLKKGTGSAKNGANVKLTPQSFLRFPGTPFKLVS